ncbi:MAG: ABC transporter permease [Oscillospiraceae bacterium]|nr:ABC transporter permease [Oscillospiraceae bacterium]
MRRAGVFATLLLIGFIGAFIYLGFTLVEESPEYMTRSGAASYGVVYDRSGDVLFDGTKALSSYPSGHFADIGNVIGDTSGQMKNTLVARNMEELANYSFMYGKGSGKTSLKTTLSHAANTAVYKAFGKKNGTAIAYNWKTGEVLVCVSKPSVDPAAGYANIDKLAEGSLLCKAFLPTVPGSTQKVSTLLAAYETMGVDAVNKTEYNCTGSWLNASGQRINCHESKGHGKQTLQKAFENSCNPYFAQLVQSDKLPLSRIIETYTRMGYSVNGAAADTLEMNGIRISAASTTLKDAKDFDTQWGCLGQGTTLVSPFQLMLWEGAIANQSGIAVMPNMLSEKTDVSGAVTLLPTPGKTGQMFTAEAAAAANAVMTENVKKNYSALVKYKCGVKSGTAQITDGGKEYENSLLAGFSADDRCPVAFCILIEQYKKGEVTTAQIAKTMLDKIAALK